MAEAIYRERHSVSEANIRMRGPMRDVAWYFPKKRKPFAYSTVAVSLHIESLSREGLTVDEAIERTIYDVDAKKILIQISEKGYGEIPLNEFLVDEKPPKTGAGQE